MAKIDANLPIPVPPALTAVSRASAGPVGSTEPAAVARGVKDATTLHAAKHGEAPVNDSKVARLRAAVLDGSYRSDASRIADRLIHLEKTLP